jgi:DNA helicase-2/ATP-dependent DNA helicase PcrA
VEAPAGCGKTFAGAAYACDVAPSIGHGRVLILTHTHAACDAFAANTRGHGRNLDIRTIDSLISEIATAYHVSLGIPLDVSNWVRNAPNRYLVIAEKVAKLLLESPIISRSLAERYPVVICDEHQDANEFQETLILALHEWGAMVRIFGDPMQRIFPAGSQNAADLDKRRWATLIEKADVYERLCFPHRWKSGSPALGEWILSVREVLQAGKRVSMRAPNAAGLKIIVADNESKSPVGYQLSKENAKELYSVSNRANTLLVLAAHKDTVDAVHSFFGRRIQIWEGHIRESLDALISSTQQDKGDPIKIAQDTIKFVSSVATGFSPSAYSSRLLAEIRSGCKGRCSDKPAILQEMGKIILSSPDYTGVVAFLRRLAELRGTSSSFRNIHIDYEREFADAIRIGEYDDVEMGFAEISRRRSYSHLSLPRRAISTIHKAKGLQSANVLLVGCDAKHFGDTDEARCKLYVAMSRAQSSLTMVVSAQNPCPFLDM